MQLTLLSADLTVIATADEPFTLSAAILVGVSTTPAQGK
jgi:hypothetical protein